MSKLMFVPPPLLLRPTLIWSSVAVCVVFMWRQAAYSFRKTGLCEIAKDMGILDLQLRSNQRMRGSNQRRGWTGLSCWINGELYKPRRERLPRALMEDLSDYPSLFLFRARLFYYILPLNLFNISQNPFCSLGVLSSHLHPVLFGQRALASFLILRGAFCSLNPLSKAKEERQKN